ncbi:M23 family metallopeptidase [Paenibacillus filicis]|uniref:M23 family metallopeptidase n=1 Tax=Paenibacillus filicis TaxID=669464 RepID=A0ABU9DVA7_9BACL
MIMLWIKVATAGLLLLGLGGHTQLQNKEEPPVETSSGMRTGAGSSVIQAEEIAEALIRQEYDQVYNQTSEPFREMISAADFAKAVQSFSSDVKTWNPNSDLKVNGGRYITWANPEGTKGLIAQLGPDGIIAGLQMVPLKQFPQTDMAFTQQEFSLPVEGDWLVFWGGENVLSNYHYEVKEQRYAYDWIQIRDGYSYDGDPFKNESYYAFGQKVTAPRDGRVAHVVNDIPDNEPVGTMNPDVPAGNMVVIDHGDGTYSFLAHLKKGSATVKVGDLVAKGDLIGLCGNSGNSSEPHLHVQVSDHVDLFSGKSLRIKWERGLEPRQGEVVHGKPSINE